MWRVVVRVLLVAGLIVASAAISRADDVPGVGVVCVANGPLIVTETNEVTFSAEGSCGLFHVRLYQLLPPFTSTLPAWTGGCGYGPGPIPQLEIAIELTDSTGAVVETRSTWWDFPETVVGARRVTTPNSTTRVLIKEVVRDAYGRPSAVGPQVGNGLLLTRLGGSCDVTSAKHANATVVFVLYGALLPSI
jgi:hypothetical protein